MDREMVGGAWVGAYLKAKDLYKFDDKDAYFYADEVARRTQASASLGDRPPINQGRIKVALNQFATFFYNQWREVRTDIFGKMFHGEQSRQGYDPKGLGSIKITKSEGYARLLRFAIATAAISAMYDKAGLPNPFKQDGAGKTGNDVADWIYDHLANVLPGFSTMRFGGSPIIQLGSKVIFKFVAPQSPGDRKNAIKQLSTLGFRLFPMGGQISKTWGGISALSQGGRVYSQGKTRRMLFMIDDHDMFEAARALLFGKWQTKAGQKYLKKRY
jgi:hypothetical protein